MKPYIETATETQALEMEKWNRNKYRSQIIQLLNKTDEKNLEKALKVLQKILIPHPSKEKELVQN